jgi:hypothetical protein
MLTKESVRPNPKEVTFYIKPRTQEEKVPAALPKINILGMHRIPVLIWPDIRPDFLPYKINKETRFQE